MNQLLLHLGVVHIEELYYLRLGIIYQSSYLELCHGAPHSFHLWLALRYVILLLREAHLGLSKVFSHLSGPGSNQVAWKHLCLSKCLPKRLLGFGVVFAIEVKRLEHCIYLSWLIS